MAENFNHTYTQVLIISLLSYEFRDRPWWILIVVIIAAIIVSIIVAVIKEYNK